MALVCARDPKTLEHLPDGQVGLLHLYTPVVESVPNLSLLTTDYGSVHPRCPCPLGGPYLTIVGRAAGAHGGCAWTADQYLPHEDLQEHGISVFH